MSAICALDPRSVCCVGESRRFIAMPICIPLPAPPREYPGELDFVDLQLERGSVWREGSVCESVCVWRGSVCV